MLNDAWPPNRTCPLGYEPNVLPSHSPAIVFREPSYNTTLHPSSQGPASAAHIILVVRGYDLPSFTFTPTFRPVRLSREPLGRTLWSATPSAFISNQNLVLMLCLIKHVQPN